MKNFQLIVSLCLCMLCTCPACSGQSSSDKKQENKIPMKDELIKVFLAGDVMTGRGIDQILPESVDPAIYESYVKDARQYIDLAEKVNGEISTPVDYQYIWGEALEVWKQEQADLKVINLETSITKNGEPWPGKGIQYRMHPENIKILEAADIDYISLANNHTLDWSRSGLSETLETVKQSPIAFGGAGKNIEEAEQPKSLKTKKGDVIVLAYGHESSGIPEAWAASEERSGINFLQNLSDATVQEIKQQVSKLKKAGDLVVFSVHWGSNWGYQVPEKQQEFAHQLIDEAGVDVIHGHSSHHPRPLEVYKGKLILYGAGDFINDYEGIGGNEQYRDDLTLMYFPTIDAATGKIKSIKMVPMQIKKMRLQHANPEDAQWLFETLNRESEKFDTSLRLNEDYTISLKQELK